MSRSLWWRLLAISVAFALVMSFVYLLLVRETSAGGRAGIQRSLLLFLAHIVEDEPGDAPLQRLEAYLADSPDLPTQLWLVDAEGRELASRSDSPAPSTWMRQHRPAQVHEVVRAKPGLVRDASLAIVRLRGSEPRYLIARFGGLPGRPIFWLRVLSFVIPLGGAIFLGLALITLYLRLRSREAKHVIARLESGDLRARFQPEGLDAVGSLMLDFNRMADEIERLVLRLQAAEDARRGLLQELGHDLRTPLTSLRTSIEAVGMHRASMPAEDREAFITIIDSELRYFVRLIDDLFFIADIAEPHYRPSSERVDVRELLGSEIAGFHGRGGIGLDVRAEGGADECADNGAQVVGDRTLLSRVFRNALDNAVKHARSLVQVSVAVRGDEVRVTVDDDGQGMGAAEIAAFGHRRRQRLHAGVAQPAISLGLGSVIIKTIVELHGGRIALASAAAGDAVPGTRLEITLPRSR